MTRWPRTFRESDQTFAQIQTVEPDNIPPGRPGQRISSAASTLGRWHSRAASKKKKKSPSDGWTGSAGGRDDELQSEASSGAVINGVLPETSAAPLSIIIRVEEPSGGMTVSVVRSLAVGGCLLRFSSPHFCQYTIEAIAGRVGTVWQWRRSPTVIHQWFPPAAGQCVVVFLHCASGSGALQRQVYWFCWDFGMVLPDFQQRHLCG